MIKFALKMDYKDNILDDIFPIIIVFNHEALIWDGPEKLPMVPYKIQTINFSSELILLIIVPTFDTKVTEYLCSGWVFFFFRQISTF